METFLLEYILQEYLLYLMLNNVLLKNFVFWIPPLLYQVIHKVSDFLYNVKYNLYIFSCCIKFICNHSIFRHDNFIGCFSVDKIKMSVRKYFCFNIPVYKNMAEGLFCRSPYHEEYIQTSASGNPEGLCRSTYSFLSERR